MYYIIRLNVEGEEKYVFNSKLFVSNRGFARKFYSLSYAKRYIKNHPVCAEYEWEIINGEAE
ncbi:MAG: hypothetical protein J6A37_11955 [Oscillospiraceae bacterium]|nr:hypothetical protein [Oscillospiraceae bacterium]